MKYQKNKRHSLGLLKNTSIPLSSFLRSNPAAYRGSVGSSRFSFPPPSPLPFIRYFFSLEVIQISPIRRRRIEGKIQSRDIASGRAERVLASALPSDATATVAVTADLGFRRDEKVNPNDDEKSSNGSPPFIINDNAR